MRLSGRDTQPDIRVAPGTVRPIRLRVAGLVFGLNTSEALDLATRLADAADQLKPPRALEIFNNGKDQS